MGIHGGAKDYITTTFINCDNSGITRVSISKYRDKTVAIDWSNIAYRFLCRSKNIDDFINEFINLIHKFAREGVKIIFVFDGRPRNEKFLTIKHRKNIKAKLFEKIDNMIEHIKIPNEEDLEKIINIARRIKTISIQHIVKCKKLFDLLGIQYIHLEDIEADSIFKLLLDNNIADICFSGDMDILAFGCKKIILDINFREDTVIEIDIDMFLAYLEISHFQLLMAFILSGTDWNNGLKKSNFAKNLDLIKKYGDIPSIITNLEIINKQLPSDKQLEIPHRFNWQFSIEVYTEVLDSHIIHKIQDILTQQLKQHEYMKCLDGYNLIVEYGKFMLENSQDLKYIKKFQEYIYWKYSYHLSLISSYRRKQNISSQELKPVKILSIGFSK